MANRDLLKSAIAEAKSVKETAIANAKLALEEAFTPHLKSMLSSKLEEMDKDDEDVKEEVNQVEEADAPSFERKNSPAGDSLRNLTPRKVGQSTVQEDEVEEEFNLDELLAELEKDELDENARTDAEEEGYKDGMKDEKEDLKEDERTDAEEEGYLDGEKDEKEDEEDKDEDEEIDLEDMSEDDLKGFIEDVIKDMVAGGEIEPGDEFAEDEVDVEVEDVENVEDVDVDIELDEGYSNKDGDKDDSPTEKKSQKGRFAKNGDVSENLDEMGDATVAAAASGIDNIIDNLRKLSKASGPAAKKAYAALQALGAGAGAAMRNEEEELDEIDALKAELQEVNLLNAKLLYTNKIFKAKNLTESKKVKVLKAFDKAEDVRQAKTIYDTLAEGLVNKPNNTVVSESVKRGFSSKATGLSPKATKQPIIESNEVFDRMRKLAGLI